MIAAVIGEELGMVGIAALVGLYGLFGYAGFRIAQSARDRYGKLLAAGLTSMVLVQALVNLLAVFGLAPLTGVPLPFVSYGNASMLVMLAAVGLLLNVSRGGSAGSAAKPSSGGGRLRVVDGGRTAGRSARSAPARSSKQCRVPRVVIAAGGTAGHVVPALAVADALRAEGAEVSFLGAADRAEAEVVPAAGYEIDLLRVRGLDRRNPLRAAGALRLAAAAVPAARRALRERGAQAVLGGGGYVAGPAGPRRAAARPAAGADRGRPPPRAHQPAARPPRPPRLPRVPDRRPRRRPRYLVTGRPVPAAILAADRGRARERFGIAADDRCLLVFGGSQGARSINLARARGVRRPGRRRARLPRPPHQRQPRPRRARAPRLAAAAHPDRYTLLEYEPGLADALAACDLVLARVRRLDLRDRRRRRARRSSCPYPYAAGDHQHANADWMADGRRRGRGRGLRARARAPARAGRRAARRPSAARARWARPPRALARPDAAERIAAELLERDRRTLLSR